MTDFRLAIRQMLKNPSVTLVAVLTLGLGIGVNSALFTVLYAVLLQPLPFAESDRLVQVQSTVTPAGKATTTYPVWSYPRYELLRDNNGLFASTAALDASQVTVPGNDSAERVEAELTSASYFSLLGIRAARGRLFLPEEDRKGAAQPVVVISDDYWQRHFGAEPGAIGQTLRVNDLTLTVVGVLPAGFKGQSGATEMWMPITLTPVLAGDPARLDRPYTMWHKVLARLKPGISLAAAHASLGTLEHRLESALPVSSDKEAYGISLLSFREATTDPLIRRSLWALACAVGFVLLIACVNVANLQLARTASRERELAMRLALGATRGRLTRQLLAESLVLAVVAGVVALVLARWAVDVMSALQPASDTGFLNQYVRLPDFSALRLGLPILAFNFTIALGCGMFFGLFPAWRASRGALSPLLHRMTDRPGGANQGLGLRGARGLLVVAETALALMLLAGAGLMVRSFARLTTAPLGFDPSQLLTFRLDQPHGATEAASQLFFQQVVDGVRTIPGVESVCLANATPLSSTFDRSSMNVVSLGKEGGRSEVSIGVHLASREFLQTLRVPLVRGRWLRDQDRKGAPLVAVVNEVAARKCWPGADPIGQRVDLTPALGPGYEAVELVGVVADVKYDQMAADIGPDVYLSYLQSGYPCYYVTMRTKGDPLALAGAARSAVAAVNPAVPVCDLLSMKQRIANSVSRDRFNTLLLLGFSVLAVVLAAVGLYGVVAYSVTQRTREIGIRIALGARTADVLRLIVKQGMRLVLVGALLGLAGALALARLLKGLLFGISSADPLTFAIIPVCLAVVALLACWVPARRAARVNPVEALRYE